VQELEACGPLSNPVRRHAVTVLNRIARQLQTGPTAAGSLSSSSSYGRGNVHSSSSSASTSAGTGAGSGSVSFAASASGANSSSNKEGNSGGSGRLYGRALQTPSKEVIQRHSGEREEEEEEEEEEDDVTDNVLGSSARTVFTFTPVVPGNSNSNGNSSNYTPAKATTTSTSTSIHHGGIAGAISPFIGREYKDSPIIDAIKVINKAMAVV
jgi:hypothetical protein